MKAHSLTSRVLVFAGILAGYQPAASAQGNAFFAVLLGGNEVNAAGQANQGDPNGFGTATVIVQKTPDTATEMVCFGIAVQGIDTPTAAHIHSNKAGANGSIAVFLAAPNGGNPGTASACADNVPNSTVSAIRNAPANFYVNVHTADKPGGALRGQLF